jgi:MOSC domain-containing protein YiiM
VDFLQAKLADNVILKYAFPIGIRINVLNIRCGDVLAVMVTELMLGNPKQPCDKIASRLIRAESMQRGNKGLCGQVLRVMDTSRPAQQIAINTVKMPTVEQSERFATLFGLCN